MVPPGGVGTTVLHHPDHAWGNWNVDSSEDTGSDWNGGSYQSPETGQFAEEGKCVFS